MERREEIRSRADVIRLLGDKTEFERAVLVATYEIPRGRVSTYGRIAERVGRPRAYRAAGNALSRNPLAPVVPCHRVVRSDGRLGGPEGDAEKRRRLLEEEGIRFRQGRIELRREILF